MDAFPNELLKARIAYNKNDLYQTTGLVFEPWVALLTAGGIGAIAYEGIIGPAFGHDTRDPATGEPHSAQYLVQGGFAAGGLAYLGAFSWKELRRPKNIGEKTRPEILAIPVALAAMSGIGHVLDEKNTQGFADSAIYATTALILSKVATEAYVDSSERPPLSDASPLRRAWHALRFGYPYAVAGAGAAAGVAVMGGDAGMTDHLRHGLEGFVATYALRGAVGNMLGAIPQSLDAAIQWAIMNNGTHERAEPANRRLLSRVSSRKDLAYTLENQGVILAHAQDAAGSLQAYQTAQALNPGVMRVRTHAKDLFESERLPLNPYEEFMLPRLISTSIEDVHAGFMHELQMKRFEYAEVFARRLVELSGGRVPQYHFQLAQVRSILGRGKEAADAMRAFVRSWEPELASLVREESGNETRNPMWRTHGGYLRQMGSEERARKEFEYASLFFGSIRSGDGMRSVSIAEPIPPIRVMRDGEERWYCFSRDLFGENLRVLDRRGDLSPYDVRDAIDIEIEMSRVAAPMLSGLGHPLRDNKDYLHNRLDRNFFSPMERKGIVFDAAMRTRQHDMISVLVEKISRGYASGTLDDGIYDDPNLGNFVKSEAGVIRIDFEELIGFPLAKEWLKMMELDHDIASPRLYAILLERLIKGTHPHVAPHKSLGAYRSEFMEVLSILKGPTHLDMAGYAADDEVGAANTKTSARNAASQKYHLRKAVDVYYANAQKAEGSERDLLRAVAHDMETLIEEGYAAIQDTTRFMPDLPRHRIREGLDALIRRTRV